MYVLSKNKKKKKHKNVLVKFSLFTTCILHGHVFVMNMRYVLLCSRLLYVNDLNPMPCRDVHSNQTVHGQVTSNEILTRNQKKKKKKKKKKSETLLINGPLTSLEMIVWMLKDRKHFLNSFQIFKIWQCNKK